MTPRERAVELLAGLGACLADGPSAPDAVKSLGETASKVPVHLLPAVDAMLRESFSEYQPDGWPRLGLIELASFRHAPQAWGVMAVAASHRNGYVREAAARGLGTGGDGRAVPYLLVRLNDWVKEVHVAARSALERFFRPEFAPDLISAMPLVWALARQKRMDHRDIAARIYNFLRSPECATAVRAGCGAAERGIRRACFAIELAGGGRQPTDVLGEALSDREPAVRLWAVREVARALPVTWAQSLALRALADRSVQIRRVALAALAPSLAEEQARELLEAALLDTNTTARWQARAFILQRGPFDLVGFYRRALSVATQPARVRGALLGLGESGKPDDVTHLGPFLSAERLGVRCAALRARAGLEPLSSVEPYLAALKLPEASVSREARRALAPRLAHVPISILHGLVVEYQLPVHTRRHALALVKGKSKWEKLPVFLDGCADPDDKIAHLALLLVDGWRAGYNRSFLQPTKTQLETAAASLARVSRRLGAQARADVENLLSVLGRGQA